MWHVWGRGALHVGFFLWRPMGKRVLGRRRRTWENNIKMDLKWDWRARNELICLRIGTSDW
jgi:hypothetical protein